MSDLTTFESRVAIALRRYADLASVDVNADALAAAVGSPRPTRRRAMAGFRVAPLLIGLLLLLALGSAAVVGSWLLRSEPSGPRRIEGIFQQTQPMLTARSGHIAVALEDGRVLIAGGCSDRCGRNPGGGGALHHTGSYPPQLKAELFDPRDGSFHATGELRHVAGSAVLLDDGRVLIATGVFEATNPAMKSYVQLYDPATGRAELPRSHQGPRLFENPPQLLTRLADGRVLILEANLDVSWQADEVNALIFDPASDSFQPTIEPSPIPAPIDAILLDDGRVLLAGYQKEGAGQPTRRAVAAFHPDTGTFEMLGAPLFAIEILSPLPGGRILALGNERDLGGGPTPGPYAASFDPATNSFTRIESPTGLVSRAITLLDGRVLILSTNEPDGYLNGAQLYDPATGTYDTLPAPLARYQLTVTALLDGSVLLAGGVQPGAGVDTRTAEVLR